MTKWHAHVARMAKHMNMVGDPGHLAPPKSGAGATGDNKGRNYAHHTTYRRNDY